MITRNAAKMLLLQYHEQTGNPSIEGEKNLVKTLAFKVPEYHNYYDCKELPAAAERFKLKNGAPVINRGEIFCRYEKPDGSFCERKSPTDLTFDVMLHSTTGVILSRFHVWIR